MKGNPNRRNKPQAAVSGVLPVFFAVALVLPLLPPACSPLPPGRDYRADMRRFVTGISTYAKGIRSDFIVIPQNGHELLTENGDPRGRPVSEYLNAIDGVAQEDLFYGYEEDNEATPEAVRDYLTAFTDIARKNGLTVLVTDYCRSEDLLDDSYQRNAEKGYLSFGAEDRALNLIPGYPSTPYHANDEHVDSLDRAKNFLYLINPERFPTKESFLNALQDTDYDVVIMDMFFERAAMEAAEVTLLKQKANGGRRLVLAYMSIGEAEEYRYYWRPDWKESPPTWLSEENPDWPGNYKVNYWDPEWQYIIYGDDRAYLKRIIDAGFDGVYLDIVDAFQYFEDLKEEE